MCTPETSVQSKPNVTLRKFRNYFCTDESEVALYQREVTDISFLLGLVPVAWSLDLTV